MAVLRRLVTPALPPVAKREVDGETVLGFLARSGLGGAYHKACEQGAVEPRLLPPPFRESVSQMYYRIYGANMARFDELARVVRAFHREGVELAPLKGVLVAAFIHRDIGQRAMSDLDILVGEPDLPRSAEILSTLGYVQESAPLDEFAGPFGRHIPAFVNTRRRVAVEVHRNVDFAFTFHGGPPDVLTHARARDIDGVSMLVPTWEHFLFHWGVHTVYADVYGGKLRDLFDLAVFMERVQPALDWNVLEAFGTYGTRPLWFGLSAAAALFGSSRCQEGARILGRAARITDPVRRMGLGLMAENLESGRLSRLLPLSVLSALSLAAHCPEHIPSFLAAFGRVFLLPPRHVLNRQYAWAPPWLPFPVLAAWRSLHVAGILAGRLSGKMIPRLWSGRG